MLLKWQDSTPHSGEGRGPYPSYYCRVGMEVRVCPQTWSGRSAVLHGTAGWARKRVPIMVSAASLLKVRDEDRALPVDLGWVGAASTVGGGMKVRVPPTVSAKEGYHFLPARWWWKTGLYSQTHRREVQPCYCRVGWKTGFYPPTSAAASSRSPWVGVAMWLYHGVHLENGRYG